MGARGFRMYYIYVCENVKEFNLGAGEEAQHLGALTALTEDSGLIPETHIRQLTTA